MEEYGKLYYKISDVSELLNVPTSTLRFWEKEFPEIKPKRSVANQRYYTPDNIRTIQMIHFLVKVKGLRIEAAKEEMRVNRTNVSRRLEIIDMLAETRKELAEILDALNKRK